MLLNNGVGIVPKYNLISNIGFDDNATHYKRRLLFNIGKKFADRPVFPMEFPLVHPKVVLSNKGYENKVNKFLYTYYNLLRKTIKKILFGKR